MQANVCSFDFLVNGNYSFFTLFDIICACIALALLLLCERTVCDSHFVIYLCGYLQS